MLSGKWLVFFMYAIHNNLLPLKFKWSDLITDDGNLILCFFSNVFHIPFKISYFWFFLLKFFKFISWTNTPPNPFSSSKKRLNLLLLFSNALSSLNQYSSKKTLCWERWDVTFPSIYNTADLNWLSLVFSTYILVL